MMKTWAAVGTAAALAGAGVTAATAQDVKVEAARVGVADVIAAAEFYENTFGLTEAVRFGGDAPVEILLNFGATPEEARANPNAQVVVMARQGEAIDDPMSHLVFRVADMDAIVAAVVANGGSVDRPPAVFGNTTTSAAIVRDPDGNLIELLHTD